MRMPMRTKWMLPKKLWAIPLCLGLSSAPAWGITIPFGSAGENKTADQRSPSILTTAKHTDLDRLYAAWAGPRHVRLDEKPPKNVSWPGLSDLPRRGDRKPSPPLEPASPMPEPSALLFFGMGLLLARRAIGRQVQG